MNKVKLVLVISFLFYNCNGLLSKNIYPKMKLWKAVKQKNNDIKINRNYKNISNKKSNPILANNFNYNHYHHNSKNNFPYSKVLYCLVGVEYIKQKEEWKKSEIEYIEVEKKLKAKTLLVLGAGSLHGKKYKIEIFETLRPYADKIILCDESNSKMAPLLLEKGLIDEYIPVSTYDIENSYPEVIIEIENRKIQIDTLVTYREEWLKLKSLLAQRYDLPHTNIEIVAKGQDKYLYQNILNNESLQKIKCEIANFDNLKEKAINFGFPLFIKPNKGIRSELACWIDNYEELIKYYKLISENDNYKYSNFILEEVISGHEVDVDMVLFDGELLYSEVSDNFPTYRPFSLETGHLMPSILDRNVQEKIKEHAYKSLLSCGYKEGIFHVELIMKPNGDIFTIETNARLGGMYIAEWHKKIWDVDLIKAELAISSGINPRAFLEKKNNNRAFAQLCVTTNSNTKINIDNENFIVESWENLKEFTNDEDVYNAEQWLEFPYRCKINVNGHPNLGEITVEGKTPLESFKKLLSITENFPRIKTNQGIIESSNMPLKKFCFETFDIHRYKIENINNPKKDDILMLLSHLSSDFPNQDNLVKLSESTSILIIKDLFTDKIVGTVSIHIWDRLRNKAKTCYIYDLVIDPKYRKIGLAIRLIERAIEFAESQSVYKIDLACEEHLVPFYKRFDFCEVGVHLAKYSNNNYFPFSIS